MFGKPALNPRLLNLSSGQLGNASRLQDVYWSCDLCPLHRRWFSMKVKQNMIIDGHSFMKVQSSETGS